MNLGSIVGLLFGLLWSRAEVDGHFHWKWRLIAENWREHYWRLGKINFVFLNFARAKRTEGPEPNRES